MRTSTLASSIYKNLEWRRPPSCRGKNNEPWFIDCVCCQAITYYVSWYGYHTSWILLWFLPVQWFHLLLEWQYVVMYDSVWVYNDSNWSIYIQKCFCATEMFFILFKLKPTNISMRVEGKQLNDAVKRSNALNNWAMKLTGVGHRCVLPAK